MAELAAAVGEAHGRDGSRLVSYAPDALIEARFGRFPPLQADAALRAGFRADANLPELARRALAVS
ncbi:hypothetical protein DBR42_25150 [Pelomonas sp. HMWF004]|nr:hypothetical protein DBR42_25150 [Pelomonas sp. HMWF004]